MRLALVGSWPYRDVLAYYWLMRDVIREDKEPLSHNLLPRIKYDCLKYAEWEDRQPFI